MYYTCKVERQEEDKGGKKESRKSIFSGIFED